jgi:predicted NAD/FAD-binding protein
MENLNIAVVGSGISGLSAAWLLSKRHKVTLYEAGEYLGGHANTVDVETPDGLVPVDTGFIVFNEPNYPNLTAMFKYLDAATEQTEMSFALSFNRGEYEYAGSGVNGFFGQRSNIFRPRHWKLMSEISRFFHTALRNIENYPQQTSLGTFLQREQYSRGFIMDHIVPMGAAIWSTAMGDMMGFPASSFIRFYANHGMLQFNRRPEWSTVTGGSKEYVKRLVADGDFEIQLNTPVKRIVRHSSYVYIADNNGVARPFDHVVIASHADQALQILNEPDPLEIELLSKFKYQFNRAVLHNDFRWMPKRRSLWSSWNYLKQDEATEAGLCLTYWMNRLQSLDTEKNLFLTLNPNAEIHPKAVEAAFDYTHPVFSASAIQAQNSLWSLQGRRRTWFCGSYFGNGFHEDGAQSGLAVAEELGGVRRPWNVENESSRIKLLKPVALEAAE